jgi:hypothetical protein
MCGYADILWRRNEKGTIGFAAIIVGTKFYRRRSFVVHISPELQGNCEAGSVIGPLH